MLDAIPYRRRDDHGNPVPGQGAAKTRPDSPSQQLARVEDDLRHARPLRFSGPIEHSFQQSREPERTRHLVRSCLVGLLLYDLFLFSDRFMVPDVFERSKQIHLVITAAGLLATFLVRLRKMGVEAMGGVLLMMVANAVYTSRASHMPDAIFVSFTIPVLIIFGNIVLPLPFALAVGYSTISAAAVSLAIWTQPLDMGAKIFAILLEASVGTYTLIATYRMERSERRAYLLTLRETLRGEALVEQNRALTDLSETDQLTGIANRRVFDRTLDQLWNDHLQSHTPLALLMIDIDHFKKLNDTHGHTNGDVCLRKAAERLRSLMRPHQTLARYGGEEFAVLLEGEGAFQAEAVAERLRAEIEAMPVILVGAENKTHRITISVGCVTAIPRLDLSPAELFIAADKALYMAKHAGRNRVHAHSLDAARPAAATLLRPPAFFDVVAKN